MHMEVAQTERGFKKLGPQISGAEEIPAKSQMPETEVERGSALQIPLVSALLEWRLRLQRKKKERWNQQGSYGQITFI